MAIKTQKIERKGKGFWEKIYIVAVFGGLKTTMKHFWRNFSNTANIDFVEYPEQKPSDITPRYRGLHRLTKDDNGELNCVACFMCASYCPSNCIFIDAQERNTPKSEKIPKSFSIDLLECVYCGLCVEACPKDAIRMDSGIFAKTGTLREDFVVDITKLSSTPRGNFA